MKRRGRFAERDQAVSKFAATLGRLCDALPADAAALVDGEGETVDYAGTLAPYDIKVAAAEWQLVLSGLRGAAAHMQSLDLTVRAPRATFIASTVSEGYSLVLQLPRRSFSVSPRAMAEAMRELCLEAGLPLPVRYRKERWCHVDVRETAQGNRPLALWIEHTWAKAHVIGRINYRNPSSGERAFRVMLDSGYETNLVRERLGRWYREEES